MPKLINKKVKYRYVENVHTDAPVYVDYRVTLRSERHQTATGIIPASLKKIGQF